MISIDFTQFIRDRVWFGLECNNIMHCLDGKVRADWIRPIYVNTTKDRALHAKWWTFGKKRRKGQTHYIEYENDNGAGVQTFREIDD